MPKSADNPNQFISRVSLVGRSQGEVRKLDGFKKSLHTVPDAVNAATSAFLARLCSPELAAEGEKYFQNARKALGYRRNDLALSVTSPSAVLTAKDFTLEIAYALQAGDPGSYEVTRTLHGVGDTELVQREEFNELFPSVFGGIVFGLVKGVRVEAVIDAVEAHGEPGGLTVDYPSDCRHCVLTVDGVDAEVVCDGATLELRFSRNAPPRELVESFLAVRSAFTLTKDRTLSGLL